MSPDVAPLCREIRDLLNFRTIPADQTDAFNTNPPIKAQASM